MAISQFASETSPAALTVGTEKLLPSTVQTTAGHFQLVLDVTNLAPGDVLEVSVLEKTTASGDTQRRVLIATLRNTQQDTLFVSPGLILLNGWQFGIKQTAGTGRVIPWSIRAVT
jgi:protein involved in polysaccharide export with SLBB domain